MQALSWLHGLTGLQQLGGILLVRRLKQILAKTKIHKAEPVMLKAMGELAGSTSCTLV